MKWKEEKNMKEKVIQFIKDFILMGIIITIVEYVL